MKINRTIILILLAVLFCENSPLKSQDTPYENFTSAVYCRVYEVIQMDDPDWLKTNFDFIQKYIHLDKVYLETHRDMLEAPGETIESAVKFFKKRNIKVSGGITLVRSEANNYETFCYSNKEHREKALLIVENAAKQFDEIILDDFFFTNCKCPLCIEAKGDQSWTEFRLKQLSDFSVEMVEVAKKINPDINFIIKYPNWYDHYHNLGYNLETEPNIFDMIYTGAETRDPDHSPQHLQPYQSYSIMRYMENVAPGRNGGAWVDPYFKQTLDRYGEQLAFALYSRPKEIMLFCLYDLNKYLQSKLANGQAKPISNVLPLAAYTLEKTDEFLSVAGNGTGVKCYRPFHSDGEDFLPSYLGMIGIPIDIVPDFPKEEKSILLTEHAKYDPDIVNKIKEQLINGKTVIITSGLLRALQGKGIEDIAELRYTGNKSQVSSFTNFNSNIATSSEAIMIPQIRYPTNDTWEVISAYDHKSGYPMMLMSDYADGKLYVLTIPENQGDLYLLPEETLTQIKRIVLNDFNFIVESPSNVCLFTYDNNSFAVHSLRPENTEIKIHIKNGAKTITDLESGEIIDLNKSGEEMVYTCRLFPHTPRFFKF